MKFGPVAVAEAEGTVLAHAARLAGGRLPKGRLLSADDISALRAAGITEVTVARLDLADVLEDEAATRIAGAIARDHLTFSPASTGRVNIFADADGLFTVEKSVVDNLNGIDPAITLACLADHVPVHSGDMVATIKIIPLAVAEKSVDRAVGLLREARPFAVKPFASRRIGLIATLLPSLKPSVLDKTRQNLEQRLHLSQSRVEHEARVAHHVDAVAAAIGKMRPLCDMIVIFGASAVADEDDVVPSAIRRAGGVVERLGMPVDPGNLLVLGRIGDHPVIGAPGCARSPKENGFDWILNRILAGEWPTSQDIAGLGVGGLLMEIPTRPSPRALAGHKGKKTSVAILLLAAGKASRMGPSGHHKLLAEFGGIPMIRSSAEAALGAGVDKVIAVTGHRNAEISAALDGLDLIYADNVDHASGMASSLIAGLDAAGPSVDGVLVMLADMPFVTAGDLAAMVSAFKAQAGAAVIRAVSNGQRGNPVILPRAVFAEIRKLTGDIGARHIIETCSLPVLDVEIGPAAHLDLDTPEAIRAAGGILKG